MSRNLQATPMKNIIRGLLDPQQARTVEEAALQRLNRQLYCFSQDVEVLRGVVEGEGEGVVDLGRGAECTPVMEPLLTLLPEFYQARERMDRQNREQEEQRKLEENLKGKPLGFQKAIRKKEKIKSIGP